VPAGVLDDRGQISLGATALLVLALAKYLEVGYPGGAWVLMRCVWLGLVGTSTLLALALARCLEVRCAAGVLALLCFGAGCCAIWGRIRGGQAACLAAGASPWIRPCLAGSLRRGWLSMREGQPPRQCP
jgi:hypothetical protein